MCLLNGFEVKPRVFGEFKWGKSMFRLKRASALSLTWLRLSTIRNLSLCLLLCWSVTSIGQGQVHRLGPTAILDSLSDGGGGTIDVSWSLEAAGEKIVFANEYPHKVCVAYAVVTDGERGDTSRECFTEGMATQSDFDVDTGLSSDESPTEYAVSLGTYYNGILMGNDRIWKNITIDPST